MRTQEVLGLPQRSDWHGHAAGAKLRQIDLSGLSAIEIEIGYEAFV
jgi:hypothetical protein